MPSEKFRISSELKVKRLPRDNFIIRARRFRLTTGQKTRIMGILNLSPDSFSGDGRLVRRKSDIHKNLAFAGKLVEDGADIIDVGGESTRPGASAITLEEEITRVIPTLRLLTKRIKKPISVDTYKETVASHALDTGASIINNIMGVTASKSFLQMVKRYGAAIVLMHIRGNPRTMQKNLRYRHPINEIIETLRRAVEKCLEIGIKSDRIIIDPGIGFGKSVAHNLEIIRRLREFRILRHPILIGTSRKSFIGKILNQEVSGRLMGTAASVCAGVMAGAHIVRVHDVKEMRDVVQLTDCLVQS